MFVPEKAYYCGMIRMRPKYLDPNSFDRSVAADVFVREEPDEEEEEEEGDDNDEEEGDDEQDDGGYSE